MDVNDTQGNGPEEQGPAEGPQGRAEGPHGPAEEPGPAEAPAEEPGPAQGPQAPAEEPTRPTEPIEPTQRRLTRSRSDRIVGGVCGGLGRYFNLDPILFRIGAVALTFVGGAGLLLYLAALLLMPNDGAQAPVAPGTQGRNRGLAIAGIVVLLLVAWPFLLGGGLVLAGIGIPLALLVGAGVLVWWLVSGDGPSGDPRDIARRAALGIGVLVICGLVAIGGAFAAAAGPDWLIGALVIVAGGAIVAGAFLKPVRWLVLPAVTLALAAGTVAAAGIDLDGGIGQREYRPGSSADLRDHYELGIGELVVDLRDTDLPAGDVPLDVDLGVGEARVIVPDDVCVATDAGVGMGNVNVFGLDHSGVDVDFEDARDARATTTRLLLHADVGMGELRVHDSRGELLFDDREFGRFHDGDSDSGGGEQSACAATEGRASG